MSRVPNRKTGIVTDVDCEINRDCKIKCIGEKQDTQAVGRIVGNSTYAVLIEII